MKSFDADDFVIPPVGGEADILGYIVYNGETGEVYFSEGLDNTDQGVCEECGE